MVEPADLSLVEVREFLLANNGRVKNSVLVLHFKRFFNDPVNKTANKEKFKEIVNKLAVVKTENGEKLIVLKKKYRMDVPPLPSLDQVTSYDSVQSATLTMDSDESKSSSLSMPSSREQSMEPPSDPSSREQAQGCSTNAVTKLNQSMRSDEAGYEADASRESSIAPEDISITEISPIVSVKDRAKVLNKLSEKPPEPKDYRMLGKIGKTQKMLAEEEKLQTVSLIDPVEHEWMIVSAKCDYLRMVKMLQDHPELARRKDYSTGYSGLHWACKHENTDAVKLLAGTYACPVNSRSHGGYTALHLAAMQGNDELMELLVKTYGADSEIRDFTGRRPKQYLQNAGKFKRKMLLSGAPQPVDPKRLSKITAEEVDAAMKKAGAGASHQGIGSFLNPQMSNLRASFRINKPLKSDGSLSPTMMRRSVTTAFTSGSESSDKESRGRSRPVSVPVHGVPKSQSDTEIVALNEGFCVKSSLV